MVDNVANGIEVSWEREDIPNDDSLYMRVHRNWLDQEGKPYPGFFRLRKGETGMSSDWDKYSSAEETHQRGRSPKEDNAVISMVVGDVRNIPEQDVIHTPISDNQAHTDITGEKTTEVRVFFGRIYQIMLPLEV